MLASLVLDIAPPQSAWGLRHRHNPFLLSINIVEETLSQSRNFEYSTIGLAVYQPVAEKAIDLGFLVLVIHLAIGVFIAWPETTVVLPRNHFCHTRIVVQAHLDAG